VANQIPTYFITKFTDQVEFLVQQMPARLWNASEIRTLEGSGAVATEQVGATTMTLVTGTAMPATITDTPAARRWIYPNKYWVGDLVDTFEKLEIAIDPQGWIARDFTFAMNRQKDDVWIANYFGNAYTGNVSTTGNAPQNTVAFPAGNIIGINVGSAGGSTSAHMNVPKLRAARLGMLAAEVDLTYDPAYCAMSAIQLDDMLNQAQAISMDFQDKPVLQEGQITRFMGFEFIHSERLPTHTTTALARQCPIWVKTGVRAGVWQDNNTQIYQRDDLIGRPFQVASMIMVGATRLQEPKCWEIDCFES
jgi:hypothetical protein